MWTKQELKERFLKLEAAHGVLMAFAGLGVLGIAYYYKQFIEDAIALTIGGGLIFWGAYKFFYNPVTKAATLKVAVNEKLAAVPVIVNPAPPAP